MLAEVGFCGGVGVLVASGELLFIVIVTVTISLLGRLLGRLIDRDNVIEEDEGLRAISSTDDL
nr:hypothetical protein [Mycobacterium leprae]